MPEAPSGVSPDTCKANMAALTRGIDHNTDEIRRVDKTTEKRLDAHAADIDEIKETMTTLASTQEVIANTQEQIVQTQNKLANMQEQQDGRIKDLEDARMKELEERARQREKEAKAAAARAAEAKTAPPKKWYETDIGKFGIKAGVVLILALAAAAIGRGILMDFGAALGLLPQ